jgi:hypothetical protein
MGIEGEAVQAKGICNIINKIRAENFQNLEKGLPIQVQIVSRTPNSLAKIEPFHGILLLKQLPPKTEKEY